MTIIEFLRLLRKHIILLMAIPVILAGLVVILTVNMDKDYTSETTLYTGIASGSSVEMDKSFSFYANNTAFDNLINVITSRETQQEVAIRLLAQHLMLTQPDPRYISEKSFDNLHKITPAEIYSLVAKSEDQTRVPVQKPKPIAVKDTTLRAPQEQKVEYQLHTVKLNETLYAISRQYGAAVDQIKKLNGLTNNNNNIHPGQIIRISGQSGQNSIETSRDTTTLPNLNDSITTFSFSKLYALSHNEASLPPGVTPAAFEQTVKNLTNLYNKNDSNFVVQLLNNDSTNKTPYSFKELTTIKAERIGTSDFVKLTYKCHDPGICQQMLVFLTDICIKNYKSIKENRSDAVVKYFEYQVKQATHKLKLGEDKLLAFNQDKNIINYYEQSKAVAVAKEALDVDYNNMKIKLAGAEAAIRRLEEKLEKQKIIQLKSAPVLEKRNQLSLINTKIATAEVYGEGNAIDVQSLSSLKVSAEKIKDEMRDAISELYHFNSSAESLPISSLLNDWIAQVISYEETKAGLSVLEKRIREFQKQYEIYAPAGSNLKRIEREISVSEQEFLELLHGLNLAKLKMQDIELTSNLKAIDEPFYPIEPDPSKRKFLIIGAAFFGFIMVLGSIMALDYFDETLKDPQKAKKSLNLNPLGIFPKIYLKPEILNFSYVADRLLEISIQNIEFFRKTRPPGPPFQILFFSTVTNEGKTVISQNLASQLKKQGNKVVLIRYCSGETNSGEQNQQISARPKISSVEEKIKTKKFSVVRWLFGYHDNRVDYHSPFLNKKDPNLSLSDHGIYEYKIDEEFFSAVSYSQLLTKNGFSLSYIPDYVLIEIPPILHYPYPPVLTASADLPVMVCRANRIWSQADQSATENFSKITSTPPQFILNGVEVDVIESVLGELQKKRSWFRKIVKKIVRFQFSSSNIP